MEIIYLQIMENPFILVPPFIGFGRLDVYKRYMDWLLKALVAGATSFAATNIDDIFVLLIFFGQRDKGHSIRHIVLGQYLGFTALVAICLVGYFARLVVPREWIGLLGMLPVAIGVKRFIEWRNARRQSPQYAPAMKPVTPSAASATLSVAGVTFANGADNIGIYTPLFATSDLGQLLVILAVFFLLLSVWCGIGYFLSSHPLMATTLDRYGHLIVPFVLIGLGLYIFYESGSLTLFR